MFAQMAHVKKRQRTPEVSEGLYAGGQKRRRRFLQVRRDSDENANGVVPGPGRARCAKRSRVERDGGGAGPGAAAAQRPLYTQQQVDRERAKWREEATTTRAAMEARLEALDAEKNRAATLLSEENRRLRKKLSVAASICAERDRLLQDSKTIKKACVLLNGRNGAQVAEIQRLSEMVGKLQQMNYALRVYMQQAHPNGGSSGGGAPGAGPYVF